MTIVSPSSSLSLPPRGGSTRLLADRGPVTAFTAVTRLLDRNLPSQKGLRPFLHQTPGVASAVLALFLGVLRAALLEASPGAPVAGREAAVWHPAVLKRRRRRHLAFGTPISDEGP